jgi:hypothetical protein
MAGLVAGALLIGSVFGTPLAQAVSAGLVRVEGGHSANLAAVSKTGRLSVDAGLASTPAGQVKIALASPADSVAVLSGATCGANGIYKIPPGKALIITGATFSNFAQTAGREHNLNLEAGPAATPCMFSLSFSIAPSTVDDVSQNQVFSPGIAVPAGDAIGLAEGNENGAVEFYGYLVPAAAVPAGILTNARSAGGVMAGKPGR